MTEIQTSQYWISPTALYISLNALGNADYIQANVASGASILCYVPNVEGLGYDNGHNYRRWQLFTSPTFFEESSEKYVYVAIPRDSNLTLAPIVFPSEHIDLYGMNEDGVQVGNTAYYYIWIRGIITASVDESQSVQMRKWDQNIVYGSLSSDEAINAGGVNSWWRYSSVDNNVTFLKDIAEATFLSVKIHSLILGGGSNVLDGVAEYGVTPDNADDKVVTPSFLAKHGNGQFLSKIHEDTAQKAITFMEGLRLGEEDAVYGLEKDGGARLGDVVVDRMHNEGSTEADRVIIGGKGFDVYMGVDGRSHLWVDNLSVRGKLMASALEVRKVSYMGGTMIMSNAGSTLSKVVAVFDDSGEQIVAYKCYAVADDGTMQTENWWRPGMMALAQTFNVDGVADGTGIGNRRYWRLVVGAGQEKLEDGKMYSWVLLSNVEEFVGGDRSVVMGYDSALLADNRGLVLTWGGVAAAVVTRCSGRSLADVVEEWDGRTTDDSGTLISSRVFYGCEAGSDVPRVGDVIVQVGDEVAWKSRGNVIRLTTSTDDDPTATAPSLTMYHGVGALRGTGVKDQEGTEATSVWQWKAVTAVISPEETKVCSKNFKWFTDDPDKVIDPVVVTWDVRCETDILVKHVQGETTTPDDMTFVVTRRMGNEEEEVKEGVVVKIDYELTDGATGKAVELKEGKLSSGVKALFGLKKLTVSALTVEEEEDEEGKKKKIETLVARRDIAIVSDGESWSLQVLAAQGNVMLNGEDEKVLTAYLTLNGKDISATLPDGAWTWVRKSGDSENDSIWTRLHEGIGRVCRVTKDDVVRSAVFECEVEF